MTVRLSGPVCRAPSCPRSHWKDGLCALCWLASRGRRRPDQAICDTETHT